MNPSRILVVEDEFIVSMEINERLAAMGYETVGSAASAELALELASQHRPDLVLMDIRLKGNVDGITAAEQIHRKYNIPVIFLTAYSEDATLSRAKLAEPFGYILKPFDDRELKSAIEIALYKHQVENEMRRLNRLYDVLSQVNQAVVRATVREELLSTVCHLMVERGAMDLAWIGWIDAATSRICPVACSGKHNDMLSEAKFYTDGSAEGQGSPGRAIREGKPYICNECGKESCPYPRGQAPERFGFQSCASFPLWFQGEVCGALNVCMGEPGFFREKEISLLEEVAVDISFALDKIEGDARRKQAEELLRESEERYRLAMDATSDGIWDWDLVSENVYYSPGYFRMLGYEPGEFRPQARSWLELIHPQDRETVLAANEACIRNELPSFSVEYRMRSRDGAWRWILGRGKAVSRDADGRALHMIGTHVDITERKGREKELEQLHRQNERILNAAGEGIVGLDKKGRITFANPAALEILGYEQKALTGSSLHDLIHHHKSDGSPYPEKECPTYSTLKTGVPVRIRDELLWKKDGTSFPSAYSAMPITEEGKISGAVVTFRDITLRKSALEALRKSEAKYRNIFENAVEGIFQTTPEGKCISVNPALAHMCGFQSPDEMASSIVDIGAQLYVDPQDRAAIVDLLTTVGIVKNIEVRFRRTDGRPLWVSISARGVRDEHGNLLYLEGTIEDIAERKRHERERELTVDFLRLMQEADSKKDMIAASIAFFKERLDCEAVGMRLREGDDYPFFDTSGFPAKPVPAENSLCTRGDIGEVVRDGAGYSVSACVCAEVIAGRFDPSKPFFTQNGSFWTNSTTELPATAAEPDLQRSRCVSEGYESVALVPLHAGAERIGLLQLSDQRKDRFTPEDVVLCEQLAGYLGVALAKFDSEERLRDSEEHFKSMFELASIGIAQTDPQTGQFVRVNQKMCEMTGYSSDELLNMRFSEITHPEDRKRDREGYQSVTSNKAKDLRIEKRYTRKDGKIMWVNVNMTVVRDSSGKPMRTVAIIEDITERKRLEEEQTIVEAQLRQAQKLEALGTLAGGVAHDFNNILGIIIGYTELSKMEIEEESALGKNLRQVMNASMRAKELVKQILAFSRRSEHRRLSLQLDIVVKEAMKMLRSSLPSTIEIKTEMLSKSPVFADPTQMHQVLMNLCTNAAHSMREKGGVLEVGLRDIVLGDEDIRPSEGLQPGRYVELRVKDGGHGIDPGITDLIFDPFFTTKALGEGTGLGLSVVHGIVKNHDGTINVESIVGRGTTFTVLLPALERRGEGRAEEIAVHLSSGKERVLVVDDEPLLAEMVRMMLSRLGYDAVSRTSGIDALETFKNQLKENSFDLVITDMTMPHLTGEDLARELSKLRPEVPVILMTGYSEKIDAEKARILGMKGFLMKPVALNDLAGLVRRVLDRKS